MNTNPKKLRKHTRPTTPEVEAVFFKVAAHLTSREMMLLLWLMGRSPADVDTVAALFLPQEAA